MSDSRHINQDSLHWGRSFGQLAGGTLADSTGLNEARTEPLESLVLATSERSGSEWLCQLISATKMLGRPTEYFNTYWMQKLVPDYPDAVHEQAVIAKKMGTTSNGIFSAKLHTWHFDRLSGAIKFSDIFPDPKFVHLVRMDRLGQAVSLYRARYSGNYTAHMNVKPDPDYDAAIIAQMLVELETCEMRWRMFFTKNNIVPLTVYYEDVVSQPKAQLRRIAKHMGVSLGLFFPMPTSPLPIQRDLKSLEWAQRFRRDYASMDSLDFTANLNTC